MVEGQKRMQQKVKMWQTRPPGSMKDAQLEMERDQKRIVEQALEASKSLERFNRWVPLMEKQIATLRIQLYWSVKNFKKVDELMPLAVFMEPMMISVKLARLYMLESDIAEIEKFFKKQVLKLRYGQGVVLYSLMAWIYVQRNDLDKANKVLIEACEKMENEVVKRNREHLANNRPALFSNTGLGEEWYALHLEQPKMKQQRQSPFAKRHF
jgi:tetratricopeptide (TPR) repeat protein